MVLKKKMRLMLAGAVVGASLLTLTVANAQFDPSGAPTTTPSPTQTTPGLPPTTESVPTPQPSPYDTGLTGTDAGTGGAGSTGSYPTPTPFETADAGFGGGGLLPPSTLGGDMLDAGLR